VVTLVLHMVRAFATASFKPPREMTWITADKALVVHPVSPVSIWRAKIESAADAGRPNSGDYLAD